METPPPKSEASNMEGIVLTNVDITELKLGNLCIKDINATKMIISKTALEIHNASFRMKDADSSSSSTKEAIRTFKTEIDPEETPTRGSSGKVATEVLQDGTAPGKAATGVLDETAKEYTPLYDPEKQAYVEDEAEGDEAETASAASVSLVKYEKNPGQYIAPHIRARSRKSQDSW